MCNKIRQTVDKCVHDMKKWEAYAMIKGKDKHTFDPFNVRESFKKLQRSRRYHKKELVQSNGDPILKDYFEAAHRLRAKNIWNGR